MPNPGGALFLANENDKRVLERMQLEIDNLKQNQRRDEKYLLNPTAGSVYVAKIPEDGIPPRSGIIPGEATCEIWKFIPSGSNKNLVKVEVFNKLVYNLSGTEILPTTTDVYVLIHLDKYGHWIVGSSGGGTSTVTPTAYCDFAKLYNTDCVRATVSGTTTSVYLRYSAGHWLSEENILFHVSKPAGSLDFYYSAGKAHLKLNGVELLDCGNKCFSGGPFTQHLDNPVSPTPCAGSSFTICLECVCCSVAGWDGPGWYCVNMDDPGAGTGTGAPCEAVLLTESNRCDDILICSGPYPSSAAASAVCGTIPVVTYPCNSTPGSRPIVNHTGSGFSLTTGDATCLNDSSPTDNLTITSTGPTNTPTTFVNSDPCEGNTSWVLDCNGGNYRLTCSSPASGVTITLISGSSTELVYYIQFAPGAIASAPPGTGGTAFLTLSGTFP